MVISLLQSLIWGSSSLLISIQDGLIFFIFIANLGNFVIKDSKYYKTNEHTFPGALSPNWVPFPKPRIPFSLGAVEKVFLKTWLLCLSESKCPGFVPVFVKESLRWVFGLRLAAAVVGIVPVCPFVRACGLQEFVWAPPQSSLVYCYSAVVTIMSLGKGTTDHCSHISCIDAAQRAL